MLKLLNKNLRRLCSRLRLTSRRCSKPKITVIKFGKSNSKSDNHLKPQNPKHAAVYPNGGGTQSSPIKPIRVATFNAALFSMAPAVPINKNDELSIISRRVVDDNFQAKSLNDRPKGILKQSPLHPSSVPHNNNNADNITKQQKFAKSRLRVSINLPDNEISLGRNRRFNLVNDGKSPARSSSRGGGDGVGDRMTGGSRRAVVDVLRELDVDILALQDVKAEEEREMRPLSDLAAALGMNYVFAESWAPEYGNAVLSKWPIKQWKVEKIFDDSDFRNVLKTIIDVPKVGEVNFYCTHLDHLDEHWRMKQINAIIQSNDAPHILAGGLNSLDESDYSEERWMDIVKYFEDMGKPTPKAEVMRFLKGKQYIDAKDFAGECESVVVIAKGQSVQGTCKYGTRVDYILASPGLHYKFVPGSYSVLSSKGTSDHHIVKADLMKVESIQEIATKKKHQQKKRVVRITHSSPKAIWSTDMR